jgi:hypothetical protein
MKKPILGFYVIGPNGDLPWLWLKISFSADSYVYIVIHTSESFKAHFSD